MLKFLLIIGVYGSIVAGQDPGDYIGCYKSPTDSEELIPILNYATGPTKCIFECKSRYFM